ncbi:extensin family protein [Taklimakanibacter deserti]|uniref:extensin family protein n=1 Tax=Taklimakanibacter deserti TaxID=2267839 RepID=UPI000E655C11
MRRMALRGLVLAACFIPALLAAEAAQKKMRPPLPKPKPTELLNPFEAEPPETAAPQPEAPEVAAPEPEASEDQPDQINSAIVIPREKPPELRKPEPAPEVTPKPEPKPDAAEGTDEEKPDPGEDFAICRKELAALGAKFKVPDMPAAEMARCTVRNPVQISAIASPAGEVDFPGEPILNCIFAKRFTSWVSDIAGPVVKAQTGEALAAIATGPGYECRGRNGDGSGKISEHALGNAVDIAAFKLASKESMPVSNVAKTENVESRWLTALRVSACGYFTTVLGPGSNAAHAEHYHFDLGLHGKSGNYRICE